MGSMSISNGFLGPFNLNAITNSAYANATAHERSEYNSSMSNATTMTAIITFVSVAGFVWFQPPSAAVVRKWNEEWKSPCTGIAGLIVAFSCFLYGTVVALAQIINPNTCSILLGGD